MRYSDTDWMDEILRVGFSQNYDLGLLVATGGQLTTNIIY